MNYTLAGGLTHVSERKRRGENKIISEKNSGNSCQFAKKRKRRKRRNKFSYREKFAGTKLSRKTRLREASALDLPLN